MKNIKIDVQYFEGCPNSEKAMNMVRRFVAESELQIKYEEILVETQEDAEKYKFRGSPTILINGIDLEGLPESKTPSLSCRYYQNSLPTQKDLEDLINSENIRAKWELWYYINIEN